MTGIDWDAVRRRGEEGMLTAAETDALVELATYHAEAMVRPTYDGFYCHLCDCIESHADDCPVKVLGDIE